jgi:hypothetical protein
MGLLALILLLPPEGLETFRTTGDAWLTSVLLLLLLVTLTDGEGLFGSKLLLLLLLDTLGERDAMLLPPLGVATRLALRAVLLARGAGDLLAPPEIGVEAVVREIGLRGDGLTNVTFLRFNEADCKLSPSGSPE